MQAELLRRAPLFASMPARVVDGLAARARRRRVRAGQRVLQRNDAAVLVVLTGRLEVVSDEGDQVTLVRSLVPPAVVGVSVAAGAPPSAEIWAAEDAELAVIPGDAVVAALRRYPEAALAAIAHLGGVIAELSAEVTAGGAASSSRNPRLATASTCVAAPSIMANRKKTTKGRGPAKADRGGWKTCSRGHRYRGAMCPQCWPGGADEGKRKR